MRTIPLPDIQFLIRIGVIEIKSPPAPKQHTRKTWTDYNRERREKLYAAGKTARGTERKNKSRKELAGIPSKSARYRTGYTNLWRAEQKNQQIK